MWLAKYADNSEKARALRDVSLAKTIAEALDEEYPGHKFRVDYESKQGVVTIRHPLTPKHVFYVIKLRNLFSDPGFRLVKEAGGQLLERAFQPRGRFREADFQAEMQRNQRAINGMLLESNWVTGETRYVLPNEWQR